MTARYPAPMEGAEGFAQLASDYLDDATAAVLGGGRQKDLSRDLQATIAIGYALLALREQLAEQPPRRRWLRRGGAR